ncbi:2'-5'-oligoadenylate synthase 1A-like [Dendronephthya gigantea]|uniref:2'-5'-oligoadenylate synthase 1A-like n=1 Tax=Dendronephthya gigantea TaxID=151771 RepID=UPI001069A59C|nr:2'-5'-oligoadenylate synthase 1A-like [Dendronephthya gigantea]
MAEFQCHVCHRSFSSLESCVKDLHSHHSFPKSCVVRGCGRSTSTRLARHLKKAHRGLCEHPCGNCSRVFVCAIDLKQHSDALHSGRVNTSYAINHQAVHDIATGFSSLFLRHSAPTTAVDFRSPTTETSLNRFIDANLQPTEAFNQEMHTDVEKVCSFLRRHMRPHEIVKGGSLGKGTAVKGNSDIDLVMILNDVRDAEDLKRQLPGIKNDVKEKLRHLPRSFTINSLTDTTFSVKFSVEGKHGDIDVDLLPAFKFEDLGSLYERMRDDLYHAEYYSAALAKQQVDFVEGYPANVKNLIRLVKHWKKKMVRPSSPRRRIPNSYLMELITIHLWKQNKGYDGTFNTLKAFHGVMEALKEYRSLNVTWTTNYSTSQIPSEIRRQRPLVMDPANPTNNVCATFDWDEIKEEAGRVLASPMMLGISSTNWN